MLRRQLHFSLACIDAKKMSSEAFRDNEIKFLQEQHHKALLSIKEIEESNARAMAESAEYLIRIKEVCID